MAFRGVSRHALPPTTHSPVLAANRLRHMHVPLRTKSTRIPRAPPPRQARAPSTPQPIPCGIPWGSPCGIPRGMPCGIYIRPSSANPQHNQPHRKLHETSQKHTTSVPPRNKKPARLCLSFSLSLPFRPRPGPSTTPTFSYASLTSSNTGRDFDAAARVRISMARHGSSLGSTTGTVRHTYSSWVRSPDEIA